MTKYTHPITSPTSPLQSIQFYTSAYTYSRVELIFKAGTQLRQIETVLALLGRINQLVNHAQMNNDVSITMNIANTKLLRAAMETLSKHVLLPGSIDIISTADRAAMVGIINHIETNLSYRLKQKNDLNPGVESMLAELVEPYVAAICREDINPDVALELLALAFTFIESREYGPDNEQLHTSASSLGLSPDIWEDIQESFETLQKICSGNCGLESTLMRMSKKDEPPNLFFQRLAIAETCALMLQKSYKLPLETRFLFTARLLLLAAVNEVNSISCCMALKSSYTSLSAERLLNKVLQFSSQSEDIRDSFSFIGGIEPFFHTTFKLLDFTPGEYEAFVASMLSRSKQERQEQMAVHSKNPRFFAKFYTLPLLSELILDFANNSRTFQIYLSHPALDKTSLSQLLTDLLAYRLRHKLSFIEADLLANYYFSINENAILRTKPGGEQRFRQVESILGIYITERNKTLILEDLQDAQLLAEWELAVHSKNRERLDLLSAFCEVNQRIPFQWIGDEGEDEEPKKRTILYSAITLNDAYALEKILTFYDRLPLDSNITKKILKLILRGLKNTCEPSIIKQLCLFIKPRIALTKPLKDALFIDPMEFLFSVQPYSFERGVYTDETKLELISYLIDLIEQSRPSLVATAINHAIFGATNYKFIARFIISHPNLMQKIDPLELFFELLIGDAVKYEVTDFLIEILNSPEYASFMNEYLLEKLYNVLIKNLDYALLHALNYFCYHQALSPKQEWMQSLISKLLSVDSASYEHQIVPLRQCLNLCLKHETICLDEALLKRMMDKDIEQLKDNYLPYIFKLSQRLKDPNSIQVHAYSKIIELLKGNAPIQKPVLEFLFYMLKQHYKPVDPRLALEPELDNLFILLNFIYKVSQPTLDRHTLPFFKLGYSNQQNREAALVLLQVKLGLLAKDDLLNPAVRKPLTAWWGELKDIYQSIVPTMSIQKLRHLE